MTNEVVKVNVVSVSDDDDVPAPVVTGADVVKVVVFVSDDDDVVSTPVVAGADVVFVSVVPAPVVIGSDVVLVNVVSVSDDDVVPAPVVTGADVGSGGDVLITMSPLQHSKKCMYAREKFNVVLYLTIFFVMICP